MTLTSPDHKPRPGDLITVGFLRPTMTCLFGYQRPFIGSHFRFDQPGGGFVRTCTLRQHEVALVIAATYERETQLSSVTSSNGDQSLNECVVWKRFVFVSTPSGLGWLNAETVATVAVKTPRRVL